MPCFAIKGERDLAAVKRDGLGPGDWRQEAQKGQKVKEEAALPHDPHLSVVSLHHGRMGTPAFGGETLLAMIPSLPLGRRGLGRGGGRVHLIPSPQAEGIERPS